MLSLICFGLLCGCRDLAAIAHWERVMKPAHLRQLGFTHPLSPCATTLQTLLSALDRTELEDRFSAWLLTSLEVTGIAIDGKTLRGSRKQGMEKAHVLSAVTHGLGCILAQVAVQDKTNEIGALPSLLKRLALEGRIVTVDALFTQRKLAQQIVAAQGHYVMLAKGNQESLRQEMETLLRLEARYGEPLDQVYTCEKSHGRLNERSVSLAVIPPDLQDWPGIQQAFAVTRRSFRDGRQAEETVYGLTSLPRAQANAATV